MRYWIGHCLGTYGLLGLMGNSEGLGCFLVGVSFGGLCCSVGFLLFCGVFLTECCQLFVYFQGTSLAKGNILLSYIFAFTIVY